jgi:hypothetical protein
MLVDTKIQIFTQLKYATLEKILRNALRYYIRRATDFRKLVALSN